MANLTDVHVGRSGDDYCLSWRMDEDKYHIWIEAANFKIRPGMMGRELYKTPPKNEHGKQPDVRLLRLDVPKNKLMVDDAIAEATAAHLFEKCEAELAAIKNERLIKAAAEHKLEMARQAGPELLKVLERARDLMLKMGWPVSTRPDLGTCYVDVVDAIRKATEEQ